jgi:hypothetical protein
MQALAILVAIGVVIAMYEGFELVQHGRLKLPRFLSYSKVSGGKKDGSNRKSGGS